MNPPARKLSLYERFLQFFGPAVLSIFLLLMRIIYGYQFYLAGSGKLHNIAKPIAFFTNLGIPFPTANAWLVACVETFGGLLLLVGLLSRPVAFALTINMTVAYLTADHDAVAKLFSDGDPSAFIAATPFWFFVTSVLVLALGPGWFSVDGIVKGLRRLFTGSASPAPQPQAVAPPPQVAPSPQVTPQPRVTPPPKVV